MSTSVEDRLRDYALRIDDAVDEYAERARTHSVPTAFLESPTPVRRPAGGRRLVAAVAVCVVACATAGVVIAQRDPSPARPTRPTTHQAAPSPTTTIGLHTIDGKTFGPKPYFGSGPMTMADYALIPDYVGVTTRDGEEIAGYVKKSDLFPVVNGQILPGGPIMPVYADGGSPLVGHFYECKGFVALGTDPATIPCTGGARPSTTPAPTSRALDLDQGTLFGFAPGRDVDPDVVRATLTPILGSPTRDTGWYRTPNNAYDCLGDQTQRVLRWGNVSFAFWRDSNPTRYTLWSWTLGDGTVEGDGDRREPQPIVDLPAIPATTAGGIGIGTTRTAFERAYPSHLRSIGYPSSAGQLFEPHRGPNDVLIGFANGKVTGIAGRLVFC